VVKCVNDTTSILSDLQPSEGLAAGCTTVIETRVHLGRRESGEVRLGAGFSQEDERESYAPQRCRNRLPHAHRIFRRDIQTGSPKRVPFLLDFHGA